MDPIDPMDEDSAGEERRPPGRRLTDASSTSTATAKPSASAPPSSSQPGASSASAAASKRRRGLGVVTPNACTECRKKRAKCDGQKPCGRCKAQKDVECVYEIPVRQSKENLRAEIEQLRRQQRSNDSVLNALVQPQLYEEVLQRLRNGQSVESISEWLGGAMPSSAGTEASVGAHAQVYGRSVGPGGTFSSMSGFTGASPNPYTPAVATSLGRTVSPTTGQAHGLRTDVDQNSPWGGHFSSQSQSVSTRSNSHPDVMDWGPNMRGPPQSRVGSWVENIGLPGGPEGQRYRGLDQVLAPEIPEMKVPPGTWTNITRDADLVQHLLALYFCWEYPTFASLSKEHFLKDFRDGRHRYCSPILVNAILALGCRFSSHPETRANPDDPHTSGDHFFKECLRLFYEESDHHNLTTIQALGIMSIREASCGRDSESWFYAGQSIRLAIEMGLHQIHDEGGHDDETAVQAATFWGAFALDHAWSLATGSLPQCSCFPHLPPKPAIIDDIEASLWIPYTDDGAPLQRSCEQPSNVRSVYKCFCELSELVHQSLYILHSPGRPLTSRDLLNIYTQYLNWYDRIPEVLRLGHNFTPAVLFAHMYYHFAILLLFRPLIKLRIIGSAILPRDVCSQAADAIQGLLRSYSQLYTLRRTPSFVPYFVLTSSIMHLAIGASVPSSSKDGEGDRSGKGPAQAQQRTATPVKLDSHVTESISRGIADLTEMAPCHHFAEQALNILRYLAKKWNIDVKLSEESKRFTNEEQDTERSVRPLTNSLNFFAPNVVEQDFICDWGSNRNQAAGLDPVAAAANNSENPLFWPFPMQGRPMVPSGQLLHDAGFEML